MNGLYIEYSWWWMFLGIALCAAATYFYYTQKQVWTLNINRILIVLRFTALLMIFFLLLDPMIKSLQRYFEKPIISYIIDDSESMIATLPLENVQKLMGKIKGTAEELEANGYTTKFYNLDGELIEKKNLEQLTFNHKSTNLSNSIQKLEELNEHENLAGITLVTDGIFNQGFSPLYVPSVVPVYTVGIGDTIPQIDLQIKDVYANKIAYMGNKFPVIAEVVNEGFVGKIVEVSLSNNGKILERKRYKIANEKGFEQIEFLVEAKKKGYQKFTVSVRNLDGEFSKENNVKSTYVEVIEGKEKILLIANAPHPDIKAIRAGVEKNKNYELHIYIPGLKFKNGIGYDKTAKYDLVILHEFPNVKQKAGLLIKKFLKEGLPIWYIVGDKTDINLFNAQNDLLMIKGYRGQKDKVTVAFNDDFKTFTYKKEQKKTLERMPPVEVPFGEYTVKSGNVLMYHKIGSVTTSKPFMMIGENNDVKTAVTVGTGLWQWRLHEGLLNQDDEAVDELISKVIQYLSTKTDKRRFRVNTTQSEYSDIEDVVIETEVYNDIYESIYGQTIDLVIQNDKGEKSTYTFLNSSPYFKYHLSDLSEGVYSFKASTEIEGKTEVAKGNFTVKTMELEALNPTANFDLLRNISDKTGGVFYEEATIDAFSDVLKGNKAPQKIHAEETYKELGSTFWMLTFIFVLLFSEWIIRKIYGAF